MVKESGIARLVKKREQLKASIQNISEYVKQHSLDEFSIDLIEQFSSRKQRLEDCFRNYLEINVDIQCNREYDEEDVVFIENVYYDVIANIRKRHESSQNSINVGTTHIQRKYSIMTRNIPLVISIYNHSSDYTITGKNTINRLRSNKNDYALLRSPTRAGLPPAPCVPSQKCPAHVRTGLARPRSGEPRACRVRYRRAGPAGADPVDVPVHARLWRPPIG
ncbi:hypothetical protein FQR65_LT17064 [Abscondita terminalis]|nr:hypothetical protein FQR65_LT17064 [Abscondita terminalis]